MKTFIAAMAIVAISSCACAQTDYARERNMMVDTQIMARGIKDPRILDAIENVERHRFVPEGMKEYAYEDVSLPVGGEKAVPPAYFTALIAKMAGFRGDEKILIVGVEAGYQAAIFSSLVSDIYCIDDSENLVVEAEKKLGELGYGNIKIKAGNQRGGWLEHAPFHVIVVTDQMDYAPKSLIDQVLMNGKIIMSLREYRGKKLIVMTKVPKDKGGYEMVATLVGPVTGEKPSGFPKKEEKKEDGKKWITGKDSKWMKKNK